MKDKKPFEIGCFSLRISEGTSDNKKMINRAKRNPRKFPYFRQMIGILFVAGLGCAVLGCQDGEVNWFKATSKPAIPEEKKVEAEQKAIWKKNGPLPGTIASVCYFEKLRPIFVQGYGLVVGLAGTGSSECPEQLRKDLIATITKYQKLYSEKDDKSQRISAVGLIESRETGVVRISGMLTTGTSKGDNFDLVVEALPNTGTTSLEGGRLYTCDLKVYAGSLGQSASSRIMARAAGPIFINPFEKKKYRGTTLLRRKGFILNGGVCVEDRRINLMLSQPSYSMARAVEQKINSLFGPPPGDPIWQTAKAVSPDKIELRIPVAYRNQQSHFLGLIQNIFVRSDPSYIESMANEMIQQIRDPGVNAPAISYAWEAMGRPTLPLIQSLYTSPNKQAVYYSARAGARLGDGVAMEQLGKIASDPSSKYRRKAIRSLGFCNDLTAKRILRKLLDDPDMELRILAYRGLARMGDISIDRRRVGDDNFTIDVVDSRSLPMVYVTRSRHCRVTLFGRIQFEPPVFYCHPDDSITVNANSGDKRITLLRKTPTGKSSGAIECSLDLATALELMGNDPVIDPRNGKVYGLGLPYSHIVAILNQMCKDGSIPAKFKMQNLTAVSEPAEDSVGRPERD